MEGEKMESHQKGFLKLKCFSPLRLLTSHFICQDSWSFSFSFSFFHAPSLEHLGGFDDIWGENHFFKNFLSNSFNILAVDAYSRMELCTPTWLNHDYRDGGVVDILAVDAYSRVEVCMLIFFGEASKKKFIANHFWKNFKTQMDTSLNKAQHKQGFLCG
jgi:hypothetical protein